MTKKIMEMSDKHTYVVIKDDSAKYNPYKVYDKWYNVGWHRKKLTEFADMQSVLWYLLQIEYGVKG